MLIVSKYLHEWINKLNGFKWKITKKEGLYAHTARKHKKNIYSLCLLHALYLVDWNVCAVFESKLKRRRFKY